VEGGPATADDHEEDPMTRLGMDVDSVERVGHGLQADADALAALTTKVDAAVRRLTGVWDGRDSTEFVGTWWPQHKSNLQHVQDQIRGLGQSALNNASEQRGASDSTSGSPGIGGAGATAAAAVGTTAAAASGANSQPATAPAAAVVNGPQRVSGASIVARARAELNTSRPTGWNAEGECVKSAQRWVRDAGGSFPGAGGPVSDYVNAGAVPVQLTDVRPGDVLQYTSVKTPDSWVGGVHTVVVGAVHPDGTLDIIQSNSPAGSGKVTEVSQWTPKPPAGFETRAWRFGQP
jgi:hypothetical protein